MHTRSSIVRSMAYTARWKLFLKPNTSISQRPAPRRGRKHTRKDEPYGRASQARGPGAVRHMGRNLYRPVDGRGGSGLDWSRYSGTQYAAHCFWHRQYDRAGERGHAAVATLG